MIKVDRAIGPTLARQQTAPFRDVDIVLSRHGAFDGLAAQLLSTVASIGRFADAKYRRGRVLLAPAAERGRRAGQHRCQVKAARDGAILAGAGARLGAILQRNSPDNSAGRGWLGNGPRWKVVDEEGLITEVPVVVEPG